MFGLLLIVLLAPFAFLCLAAFCCIVWSVFQAIFLVDFPEELKSAANRKATKDLAQVAKQNLGDYDEQ